MGACMVVGDFLVRFLVLPRGKGRTPYTVYETSKLSNSIRTKMNRNEGIRQALPNGPKEIAARLAVPVGLLSIEFADVWLTASTYRNEIL